MNKKKDSNCFLTTSTTATVGQFLTSIRFKPFIPYHQSFIKLIIHPKKNNHITFDNLCVQLFTDRFRISLLIGCPLCVYLSFVIGDSVEDTKKKPKYIL